MSGYIKSIPPLHFAKIFNVIYIHKIWNQFTIDPYQLMLQNALYEVMRNSPIHSHQHVLFTIVSWDSNLYTWSDFSVSFLLLHVTINPHTYSMSSIKIRLLSCGLLLAMVSPIRISISVFKQWAVLCKGRSWKPGTEFFLWKQRVIYINEMYPLQSTVVSYW